MKRILSIFFIIAVLLGFSGCGEKNQANDKLSVVCTIFPQYDIVRQIAGDKVELKMLLPYGMESHDYRLENLSARDLQMIMNADIFIYVGGESDRTWVEEIKRITDEKNIKWLPICEMTDTLFSEEHYHHEHEHSSLEGDFDEHIWTSPLRMIEITDGICEALTEADPENGSVFESGAEKYKSELKILDEGFKNLNGMNGETLIFADRFPFRYLSHDYGFKYAAAFDGCGTAVDPSAMQIAGICEKAQIENSKTVFYLENSNMSYAETVAETIGAECRMLHSCHNVTKLEFSKGVTYLGLMEKNLKILTEAAK